MTYEQWLRELPDWLESQKESKGTSAAFYNAKGEPAGCILVEGGLILSKKVLDQTLEILRAITEGDVRENLSKTFGE